MNRNPERKSNAYSRPAARRKKAKRITPGIILKYSFLVLLVAFLTAMVYQYRNGLLYYLGFKTNKRVEALTKEERKLADLRIYEIVSRHKDKVFGIDVSHYQGRISWADFNAEENEFPLHFVFIRATAGTDMTDAEYFRNWKGAASKGFIKGAYHYYRPDENSIRQAENFIKNVKLRKGDLPPVLDIEKLPARQSTDSLVSGLKRWLNKIERHYGVKPIIYSGESFYTDFLKKEFAGYNLWIANYSFFEEEIRKEWLFWQFTDRAGIKGINGNVDVNIYNGSYEKLKRLTLK